MVKENKCMSQQQGPPHQEPIRVEYRYAATPEEQARLATMQKRVGMGMGIGLVFFIVLFLIFLGVVGVVAYVFLHNAAHLF
jgi:hypothetical protein